MGDQTQVKLYSMLLAFLEQRGRSLAEFGSAERGLDLDSAMAFLNLLRVNHVPVLGVELWRSYEGGLEIDVSEIWYSESSGQVERYEDVERYFSRVKVGAEDVFAIQFGGSIA